jgi:microcystin degradation protein MlrC
MRVFAATLATETNTFSPIPTGLESFTDRGLYRAGEHPDEPTLFTAPLWVARQRAKTNNWQVIEGLCAFAQPAGITTRAAYETLRDELLDDLRRALPVDIVLLGMHGAMVADGYEDCEGDLLTRARSLVGPGTVIGGELDPHCHMTRAMVDNADVLICFKEYPHTDFVERAEELVGLCAAAAKGEIKPAMSLHDCRMIGIYHTPREPMRGFVDRMQAREGQDGILSISVAHGFPWGDVPDLGTRVLVVTDGAPDKGARVAAELAGELTGIRTRTMPAYLSIAGALDEAMAIEGGPVVIADVSDNPGGGAPGDSTFILAALIERDIGEVALGPLWDPMAARLCFEAGEGANLSLRIGGKTSSMSGAPLDVEAQVLRLVRGAHQGFGASQVDLGDSAAIRIGGIEVVLTSIRVQAMGRDLFTGFGIILEAKKLLVVKSSQHFYAAFAPVAKRVLYCTAPGAIAPDLTQVPYRRATRPLWPLDQAG